MFSYIYLASQSPRRQELLKQIGVQFEMLVAGPGEDTETLEVPLPNEKARDYVERVTFAKSAIALARWQSSGKPWAPILCADTTVSLPGNPAGEILGKPNDAADAERILKMLSGRVHEVLTSVVLMIDPLTKPLCLVQVSEVEFAHLTQGQIDSYIESGEPFGKAGAYGIQGSGGAFIPSIKGSYSGIMGLPIFEVNQLLDFAKVARI
ncbi:MAG: septum formation protein Maf [Polynucleobacter sp. 24-46-87]|uniref:Maf family protein n=1 Tax=Polynucleobacter sp. AP-Jannik-300A-C4 TaxID=2576928 RepID=UPI000BC608B8|nr:Maf family protein [Polynucleobacter sp. AP-Jannik-300A-C4]OZA13391.1 MAG: septum formation protein Maf [Polynucleobacter sp. 24-46-87]QWE23622.1 septum formation protein Maf [Polynucleobacter sp. AP-Jannik-300A-C4]